MVKLAVKLVKFCFIILHPSVSEKVRELVGQIIYASGKRSKSALKVRPDLDSGGSIILIYHIFEILDLSPLRVHDHRHLVTSEWLNTPL